MLKIATLSIEETIEEFLFLWSFSLIPFDCNETLNCCKIAILGRHLSGPSSTRQSLKVSGNPKLCSQCSSLGHHLAQTSIPHPGVRPAYKFPEVILQMTFLAKIFQNPNQKPQVLCHLHRFSARPTFFPLLHLEPIRERTRQCRDLFCHHRAMKPAPAAASFQIGT